MTQRGHYHIIGIALEKPRTQKNQGQARIILLFPGSFLSSKRPLVSDAIFGN